MISLPLFDLNEKESEIVEEMCNNLKEKKHCIPENELDRIIMGMYLNILKYIELEKQDNLMEIIDMATKTEGVIAKWKREQKNEGITQGITQGEKNIILELLKNNSLSEVSQMIHKDVSEIKKIIEVD